MNMCWAAPYLGRVTLIQKEVFDMKTKLCLDLNKEQQELLEEQRELKAQRLVIRERSQAIADRLAEIQRQMRFV